MSPPLCLVTGGAGFIGSHLVRHLLGDGYAVRVVDNFVTGSADNLTEVADRIDLVTGDLVDPEVCERSVAGADVVFHLAALGSVPRSLKDPWTSHQANVNATVRLLEAARAAGVRRLVFSSSSSVYGDTPTLPKVESMEPLPRSPYAASKLSSEQYVLAYARARLLEGVALRYFNVFGPRQSPTGPYAAIIPLLLRAASADPPAPNCRETVTIGTAAPAPQPAATEPAGRCRAAPSRTHHSQVRRSPSSTPTSTA
jgi:UDP-glucose 4-epimerase